jgi:hypothetical protein
MNVITQEILDEVKKVMYVQFIDHATSLLRVVASNVWSIFFSKANKILHQGMVFHQVNDGLGNSVNRMKDWHEMIRGHANTHKKKVHE